MAAAIYICTLTCGSTRRNEINYKCFYESIYSRQNKNKTSFFRDMKTFKMND